MRQIFLDTETTGLLTEDGHRIIEIGCIEMINRQITGNNLHLYLNPERDIDAAATEVHGITNDQLADKPKFAAIADQFLKFVDGSDLIIHNAAFDMGFLEYELGLLNKGPLRKQLNDVIDTLVMAKQMFPGKRKSLDALCERFGISNAHRVHHGALLDAGLLAEVYLSMTQGQDSLAIDIESDAATLAIDGPWPPVMKMFALTQEQLEAHQQTLDQIEKESKKPAIWRALAV
jgi:DNA polymerase III subunit epsilon